MSSWKPTRSCARRSQPSARASAWRKRRTGRSSPRFASARTAAELPHIGPRRDDIIRLLDLQPHPEGGYFRETFRDARTDSKGRAASTAIYFLLKAGEVSRWHRVDAAEVWHWYAGAPLELSIVSGEGGTTTLTLGANLHDGERPQAVVPAHHWQSARSLGAWTLVGCTVTPGFEFSRFELADATFRPTT